MTFEEMLNLLKSGSVKHARRKCWERNYIYIMFTFDNDKVKHPVIILVDHVGENVWHEVYIAKQADFFYNDWEVV